MPKGIPTFIEVKVFKADEGDFFKSMNEFFPNAVIYDRADSTMDDWIKENEIWYIVKLSAKSHVKPSGMVLGRCKLDLRVEKRIWNERKKYGVGGGYWIDDKTKEPLDVVASFRYRRPLFNKYLK